MSQLLISDIGEELMARLRERAARNARTVEAEAREILTEAVQLSQGDPWAEVDAIYNELAATGRTFGDSVELLREDRER
jgi:plasmid stability protein